MIAVDTSVIAALVLPTSDSTIAATKLLSSDRDWVAPLLWRSELTNILATGTRNEWFTLDQALEALSTAEELMDGGEYRVPAPDVLRLASESGCTGYDCEFVVLARDLDVKLVTQDRQILKSFPGTAIALSEFRSRRAP
jgi:predicted nucleic acid-binding protein